MARKRVAGRKNLGYRYALAVKQRADRLQQERAEEKARAEARAQAIRRAGGWPKRMAVHRRDRAPVEPATLIDMEKVVLLNICRFLAPKKYSSPEVEADKARSAARDLGSLACAWSGFGRRLVWQKDVLLGTCTGCGGDARADQDGAPRLHPNLAVLLCEKCLDRDTRAFELDEDGYEVQCRWCGVGGDLVGCDHCVSSYCELCIERNMGKMHLDAVKQRESWRCYSCDPGPMEALRWNNMQQDCVQERSRKLFLSVVEETARRWVTAWPAKDQALVTHWSGWVRRMHEMQRPAAVFSRSNLGVELSQGGAVASAFNRNGGNARSTVTMRSGRHYAVFTVRTDPDWHGSMAFGLIRPGYMVALDREKASDVDSRCFYCPSTGRRYPSNHDGGNNDWEGRQGANRGDTIGLLLDLDLGTLTVLKNNERLGVMATDLSGEYCWAVSLQSHIHTIRGSLPSERRMVQRRLGASVRIEPAPVPTQTTAEVAAAAAAEKAAAEKAATEEVAAAENAAATEEIFVWAAGDEATVTRAGNTRLGCAMGMGQDAAMSEESWAEMAAKCGVDPEAGFTLREFRAHFTDSLESGELMELLENVRRVKAAEARLPPMCSGPTRLRLMRALYEAGITNKPHGSKDSDKLGVPLCARCCGRVTRDFKLDDDGYEMQCRWCGVGGDLVGCDICVRSFCESCIARNLGSENLDKAKKTDEWRCYICDPSAIAALRRDKCMASSE